MSARSSFRQVAPVLAFLFVSSVYTHAATDTVSGGYEYTAVSGMEEIYGDYVNSESYSRLGVQEDYDPGFLEFFWDWHLRSETEVQNSRGTVTASSQTPNGVGAWVGVGNMSMDLNESIDSLAWTNTQSVYSPDANKTVDVSFYHETDFGLSSELAGSVSYYFGIWENEMTIDNFMLTEQDGWTLSGLDHQGESYLLLRKTYLSDSGHTTPDPTEWDLNCEVGQDYNFFAYMVADIEPVQAPCPSADYSGNCFVDYEDFVVMVGQWLDGYDCNDLTEMASQWLTGIDPSQMAYIPGGEFEMGDHFDPEGYDDELPVHAVLLDSFFMSRYEITNQQYCDYLNSALGSVSIYLSSNVVYGTGNNQVYCDTSASSSYSYIVYSGGVFTVGTKGGRDMSDDPMVNVSWYGAVAYCNWQSSEGGYEACYNLSTWDCDFSKHGYRLATEAEWEYAARGGLSGKRFPWSDPNISHNEANYYANPSYPYDENPTSGFHPDWNDGIFPYTSVVGSFSANGYGLYDMAGNVWEWCNDWYDDNYYDVSPYDNPQGPVSSPYDCRVLRGGCWGNAAGYCRVAHRSGDNPGGRSGGFGFRIVLDLN